MSNQKGGVLEIHRHLHLHLSKNTTASSNIAQVFISGDPKARDIPIRWNEL